MQFSEFYHPSTGLFFNNIGVSYQEQKKYGKALESYQMALAIYNRCLEKSHIETLKTMSNMGEIYYKIGDLEKSLSYFNNS